MFFEQELISFCLLDVLKLKQKNVHLWNCGRNFDALSFRFAADTRLKTKNNEYHMKENYLSYVPARLDYSRQSKTEDLIAIHFNTTNYNTKNIEYFIPTDPTAFANLFREIWSVWEKKETGYQYRCSALLCEIFAECHIQNHVAKSRYSKIQNSVEFLLKNYKKSDLSIKEIADKSFLSEVYFRKLFKEEYGISPQKYIINLRIQNAAGLISAGYYSLKDIASMSGYDDYKYFLVEFKKKLGVSPSQYRYDCGRADATITKDSTRSEKEG